MLEIALNQAKPDLAKVLHTVELGEKVLVNQNNGKSFFLVALPAMPKKSKNKPKFGSAKGQIKMSDDFDEPLAEMADYMPSDLQLVK